MNIAELTSKLSYAKRLQVGSVIVKENKILATGYNGMPTGWDNNCEVVVPEEVDFDSRTITPSRLITKPEVLHSEMNSLMKVTCSTESSAGATMFCTHSPCIDCAKAIYQAGILILYYREEYKSNLGLDFLIKSGIKLIKYDLHNK